MVTEITIASSWEVCIPFTSLLVKVIASLFYLFVGATMGSLDKDPTSTRGLEQPLVVVCMTLETSWLASNSGGTRMADPAKIGPPSQELGLTISTDQIG